MSVGSPLSLAWSVDARVDRVDHFLSFFASAEQEAEVRRLKQYYRAVRAATLSEWKARLSYWLDAVALVRTGRIGLLIGGAIKALGRVLAGLIALWWLFHGWWSGS